MIIFGLMDVHNKSSTFVLLKEYGKIIKDTWPCVDGKGLFTAYVHIEATLYSLRV